MCRASAVSCSVIPPKNRHSTTRASRSSIFAELVERFVELEQRLGADRPRRSARRRASRVGAGRRVCRPCDAARDRPGCAAWRPRRRRGSARDRASRRVCDARELEIELVDERRRRERVARTDCELASRGATELVIDEGKDLIECFAPAGAQIREQLRHACRGVVQTTRWFERGFRLLKCGHVPGFDVRRLYGAKIDDGVCPTNTSWRRVVRGEGQSLGCCAISLQERLFTCPGRRTSRRESHYENANDCRIRTSGANPAATQVAPDETYVRLMCISAFGRGVLSRAAKVAATSPTIRSCQPDPDPATRPRSLAPDCGGSRRRSGLSIAMIVGVAVGYFFPDGPDRRAGSTRRTCSSSRPSSCG